MRKNLLAAALGLLIAAQVQAGDWPQFRGPNHDGSCEKGWFNLWTTPAPKILWTAQVGGGSTSLIVSAGKVYAFGNSGSMELLPKFKSVDAVTCLDAETGKELWQQTYEAPFLPVSDAGGPNATPTCDGKCVYTISKLGFVHCYDADKGTLVWERKLVEEPKAIQGLSIWGGIASSPLLAGDSLIVSTGDCIVLDKKTGTTKFTIKGSGSRWVSPVPVTTNGKVEVVIPKAGLTFFDPATGSPSREFHAGQIGSGDPLFFDGNVYLSSRKCEAGSRIFALTAANDKPVPEWKSPEDGSYWGNAVHWGDYIFDGQENGLACLEAKTGAVKWREKSLAHAQPVVCDGKLLVMNFGKLMVLDAGPEFKVLASADVLANKPLPGVGRFSLAPALTPGRLYVKQSNGDVACVDVSGK